MMKVAYFCEPQVGGTFSFFRRMRPALAAHGVDFRCISPFGGQQVANSRFAGTEGVEDARFPAEDRRAATDILIQYLIKNGFAAVLVLPGSEPLSTNLVRYLPRTIRAAARVPMITRGVYAPCRAVVRDLDLVFAVSDRVADDLSGRYGVPPDMIRTIYNGADLPDLPLRTSTSRPGGVFQLFYSGRLSDLDKGVRLLPDILQQVRAGGTDARLILAGTGPDEARLREEFQRRRLLEAVEWKGNISLDQVTALLAETDCFLLPSRFEGCPNALLEAMAAGCACVAARIRGSVDQIVEDGRSGLLATVADPRDFAAKILALAGDPVRRRQMGEAARQRIADRFTAAHTAAAYAEALASLRTLPDRRLAASDLRRYHLPRALKPTWRTWLPPGLKNLIRKWMERFGISS